MIRRVAIAIIASFIACAAYAQGAIQKDFVEACAYSLRSAPPWRLT